MEIIKLNLIPSGVNPTCHCSQYDNGRVIRIDLFDGLTPYVLQSGDTVTLNVRKPDNTIIEASVTATQGNTYVNLVTTEQMCAVVGYNLCDLTITNGSVVIGTLNFIMQVERDVLADGIPSQSVIEDLDALVQEAVGDNYYTKTEVDDALDLKADKSTTYTKTEVDAALDPINDELFPTEELTVSWNSGQRVATSTTTGKVQINNNANYSYTRLDVQAGDKFLITSTVNSTNYPSIVYADAELVVLSKDLLEVKSYTDEETTVPNNAVYMYVQSYGSNTKVVKSYKNVIEDHESRIVNLEKEVKSLHKVRIASVNCGTFNHVHEGDFPVDPDYNAFLLEWRKMIDSTGFDIFFLEDFTDYFDSQQTMPAQEVLFDGVIKNVITNGQTSTRGLRAENRYNCEYIGELEVVGSSTNPFIYNNNSYTAVRRYAEKIKISVDNHDVVIYFLHFVPGTTAGYPGAFRRQQFTELMADAANYDNCVFVGDFNCHSISEYDIFTQNGYKICNGGRTGNYLTLRDAYADNIICSSNLCLDEFEVLDGYNLSTDHYPLVATLRYIGN